MFPAVSGIQVQVEDPGLGAGEDEDFKRPDDKNIGTGKHTVSIPRINTP